MRSTRRIWKGILAALMLCAAVACVLAIPDFSVESLLALTPEDTAPAIGVILLLYAVKGATIVFPLSVLQIVAGLVFPTGIALIVNLAGLGVVLTVPFVMGRYLGIEAVDTLARRYPRFGAVIGHRTENSFFLCLILRLIGELPGDVVTMYLAATNVPYLHNLTGGILGMLPKMALTTLLGATIQEPGSPAFWISVSLRLLLSAASLGGYCIYQRRTHGGRAGLR